MPWQQESPLSAALGFLSSYITSAQQRRDTQAEDTAKTKQQQFENDIRKRQLTDEEGRTTQSVAAARAKARAEGWDYDTGNPLPTTPIPKELTQVVPHNKGKGGPGTLEQQRDHFYQIARGFVLSGKPQDAAPAAFYKAQGDAIQKQIDAANTEKLREQNLTQQHLFRLQEKGTPSYGELHRTGRGGAGLDDDTVTRAEAEIAKSAQPELRAQEIVMRAQRSGASTKTIEAIRSTGAYYQRRWNVLHPKQSVTGAPPNG